MAAGLTRHLSLATHLNPIRRRATHSPVSPSSTARNSHGRSREER
jgi:hypothetical protein